jgi:hypothetical protein
MEQSISFGEKAVGRSASPVVENREVDEIKLTLANFIDDLNDLRDESESPEVKRMLSLAIIDLQTAGMWAVKAVTWQV